MAEEFQAAGICGGNWWNINPTRGVFPLSSSSPCSMAANDAAGSNYSTWQTDLVDLKVTRSCADDEETNNSLVSGSSLGFLDATKPQQSESASGNGSILIDSTLQMMGFGLSSSSASSNWNHSVFRCSGRPESNFYSVLQEEKCLDSSNSPTTQKDWRQKSFSSGGGGQVSTINDPFKQMNQELSLDHHQQSLSSVTSTGNSAVTCQGLSSGGFPIGSASYGYPSTLIQSLYDPDIPQPQHSLFTNRSMAYSSCTANYIGTTSNELSPTNWSKASDPFLKPSMPKQQQQPSSGLHFSNNTPFWNASAEALNDIRAGVFAPSQAQYQTSTLINEKPSFPSALLSTKPKTEEAPNSASVVKKSVCEPGLKRQRIETPSPLPTFKVRKEKLGDRITALQQLVSPFGKTDTASVLHEAIEYIKFLHDQVSVLSTPYMKNGAPIQHQQLKGCDLKDSEGPKQDLRSRGLCLVPISSTFPVTNETTADFWTPAFGGALIR